MGGRGMSMFSTNWTKKDLKTRIDSYTKQIEAIDAKAKAAGAKAYQEDLQEERRYMTTEQERKQSAEWAREAAWSDVIEDSNRGKLIYERKKLQRELDELQKGQRSLFG